MVVLAGLPLLAVASVLTRQAARGTRPRTPRRLIPMGVVPCATGARAIGALSSVVSSTSDSTGILDNEFIRPHVPLLLERYAYCYSYYSIDITKTTYSRYTSCWRGAAQRNVGCVFRV